MHRVVSDYTRVEGSDNSNIKVYVRARPLEIGDVDLNPDFLETDKTDDRKIVIRDPDTANRKYGEVSFQFDRVFWTEAKQDEIFNVTCKPQVDHIVNGYNCCCFAYGQTGSGKTYTMFGDEGEIRGVIPRSVEYLFQKISKLGSLNEVAVVCSFLEIYNDQIRDLGKAYLVAMGVESSTSKAIFEKTSDIFENLSGKRGNPYFAPAFHKALSSPEIEVRPGLKEVQDEYNTMNYEIREDNEGNVFVKDLSLIPVTSIEEVMSLIKTGLSVRATHETKMNAFSSRSHTVFTITVLQRDKVTNQTLSGMLNLVDLAGCERLKKSESQGIRLKEALHINTSLTALGKVIMALDPSSEQTHVPYRDSKLTRVLQNSLGGNSITSVITAVHPTSKYHEECLSTLQFANRCRNVRNNPRVNYIEDGEDKDKRIRKLMDELDNLKTKSQNDKNVSSSPGKVSMSSVLSILKKLGINATQNSDGSLNINGKKFTNDDLDSVESVVVRPGKEGGGSSLPPGNSSGNVKKLQDVIKDLKESNSNYQAKAKERKVELDEQGKELQRLSTELVKVQLTLKHKEFEYNSLMEEKDRCILEQKIILEQKFEKDIVDLVKKNEETLKSQQFVVDNIPDALSDYTDKIKKIEKQKLNFGKPLKEDFEKHLAHLEESRLRELSFIKKQYEYWLLEKDKALSGFVENFNRYRTKKSEQLRLAEHEIVRLYDYTEKVEHILEDVEKGKFQMQQTQGAKGGKSTTGINVNGEGGGATDLGGIIFPKGLKPTNPLKIVDAKNNGLELTKRIVSKHKERVARIDRMKEDAFRKSLHYASLPGATATGVIDPSLQKQVRDLLVAKNNKSRQKITDRQDENKSNLPTIDPSLIARQPVRPNTTGVVVSRNNSNNNNYFNATAPGNMQMKNKQNNNVQWDSNLNSPNRPNTSISDNDKGLQTSIAVDFEVLAELEELRAKNDLQEITTQKILDELANNETLLYIQKLEKEVENLKKTIKDLSNQLLSTKISQASLTRKF